MSDFWLKKLGTSQQSRPVVPPSKAEARPWWQNVPVSPPQQVQQAIESPTAEQEKEYRPTKAQHLRDVETCPNCHQQTLLGVPGNPDIRKRCHQCGWPVEHLASSMAVPSNGEPVEASRQVSTANNFSFGNVIGTIKKL